MRKFFYVLLCAFFVLSCAPSDPEGGKNDSDHGSVVDADDKDIDTDTEDDSDDSDTVPDYDPCDCDDCCLEDPCNPNPCKNVENSDGNCFEVGWVDYECGCVENYFWNWEKCESPCDPNPCENDENSDGNCAATDLTTYQCGCINNHAWDKTEAKCLPYPYEFPCDFDPCENVAHSDGTCYETSSSVYECGCVKNYFWNGEECKSPCDPNPCADNTDSKTACFAADLMTYECREPEVPIRIVAGNITSGDNQSYDPGHGIRIFQALKPDIALVQEMNYKNNSASDYKSFAQQIVGTNYYAVDDADYQIPNGVVSKYPITSHGYWKDPNISNRALMWAVVDIPGEKDIFAISVHLHTSPASDQTKAALVIVDEIAKLKSANPDKYYYVVGGDFNGDTAVSSSGFGKNNTFYVSGPDPVDEEGYGETNANRNKQYDFVLADYPLHEFQVPTVYYSSKDSTKTKSYENGLVFDTRLYSQSVLDEYFSPAQQNDSNASSMQHMAVVKDFLIEIK